ncbi:MAG TPA: YciI family protein [Dehalococcoidia bacterium]|jgi:hypothetical protein
MPTYAAIIYRDEASTPAQDSPDNPKQYQELYQAWGAFNAEVGKAGVLKIGTGLLPSSSATTVRLRDGKTLTTDGPFAETREQLGGFFIFECKDLDEAIEWASKIPDARTGAIELRPVWGA